MWILEKNVNLGEKCEFGKRIWILEKNVNLGKKNVNFVKYVNFRKNVIFEKCELR